VAVQALAVSCVGHPAIHDHRVVPCQPGQRDSAGLPAGRVEAFSVELHAEQMAAPEVQEGRRPGAGELDCGAGPERRGGRVRQVQLDQDTADLQLRGPLLRLGTSQAQDASTR
jgi:hypothetical protein